MSTCCYRIRVMSGAQDGRIFNIDRTPIMVGRHSEDDIYLSGDNRLSRHHARITREGDSFFIEDVGPQGKGSTNGTYVGKNRVAEKTAISPGDIILLGSIYVKFESRITRTGQ